MPTVFSKETLTPFRFDTTSYMDEVNALTSCSIKTLFNLCAEKVDSTTENSADNLKATSSQTDDPEKITYNAELLYCTLQRWHILKAKESEFIKNQKKLGIRSLKKLCEDIKGQQAILIGNSLLYQFNIHGLLRRLDIAEENNYRLASHALDLMSLALEALEQYNEVNIFVSKTSLASNIAKLKFFLFFNSYKSMLETTIDSNLTHSRYSSTFIHKADDALLERMQKLYTTCKQLSPSDVNNLDYVHAYQGLLSCYHFKILLQCYLQSNNQRYLKTLNKLSNATFSLEKVTQFKHSEVAFRDYILLELINQLTSLLFTIKSLLNYFTEVKTELTTTEDHFLGKILALYPFILEQLFTLWISQEQRLTEKLTDDRDHPQFDAMRIKIQNIIISLILLQGLYEESLYGENIHTTKLQPEDTATTLSQGNKLSPPLARRSKNDLTEPTKPIHLSAKLPPISEEGVDLPGTAEYNPSKKKRRAERMILKNQAMAKKLLKDLQKHQQHLLRLGLEHNQSSTYPHPDLEVQRDSIAYKKIFNLPGAWYAAVDPGLVEYVDKRTAKTISHFFQHPRYAQKKLGVKGIKPVTSTEKLRGIQTSQQYPFKLKLLGKQSLGDLRLYGEQYTDETVEPPRHFLFFNTIATHDKITRKGDTLSSLERQQGLAPKSS